MKIFQINLSSLQILKIIFTLFLLIVFIYMYIIDNKSPELKGHTKPEYHQSGLLDSKYLKLLGQIVIGSTSLVSSAITTNDQINVKKRLDQMQRIIQDNNIELENTKTLNVELQKEIKQAKEVNSGINSRIINLIKYNNTQVNNLRHKESLINELNNCKNPSDIDRLKSEILDIDNKIKYNSEISLNGLLDIEKESKICVEKGFGIDSIKKNRYFRFLFNLDIYRIFRNIPSYCFLFINIKKYHYKFLY